jgi:hypothetical protein
MAVLTTLLVNFWSLFVLLGLAGLEAGIAWAASLCRPTAVSDSPRRSIRPRRRQDGPQNRHVSV